MNSVNFSFIMMPQDHKLFCRVLCGTKACQSVKNIKVKGQMIQKIEWRQTNAWMDGRIGPNFINLCAIAVCN